MRLKLAKSKSSFFLQFLGNHEYIVLSQSPFIGLQYCDMPSLVGGHKSFFAVDMHLYLVHSFVSHTHEGVMQLPLYNSLFSVQLRYEFVFDVSGMHPLLSSHFNGAPHVFIDVLFPWHKTGSNLHLPFG